jgi:hypothetical protein
MNGVVASILHNILHWFVTPFFGRVNRGARGLPVCLYCSIILLLTSCSLDDQIPPEKVIQVLSLSPASGKGGTEVQISGNNFSKIPEENLVYFNGAAAEVKTASPTHLTVNVPAFAGIGPVRVVVGGDESLNQPIFNFIDPVVTTIAGTSGSGYEDGPMATAKFAGPLRIAFGDEGSLYVADGNNYCIRKIDPLGKVTTFAGGTFGYHDGSGTEAQFAFPAGIVVDSQNNIIVADTYNNVIRRITPQGEVSTLAGSLDEGLVDGPANQARFASPEGLAIDEDGNIYVADFGNHRIRKISADGIVSTLAGSGPPWYGTPSGSAKDGPALESILEFPESVEVGKDGNVLFTDYSDAVRVISHEIVTTFAGGQRGYKDGTGPAAGFYNIGRLRFAPSGDLFVCDRENARIRRITAKAEVSTFAGNGVHSNVDGPVTTASIQYPWDLAFSPTGALYVTSHHSIRKIE